MSDPAVRKFGFSAIKTLKFTRDDTRRAIKFSQLVRIPPEMRDDDGQPGDLAAMGRGLAALRLPSKSDVSRQLDTIAEQGIPFLVVTGGWSPAFEAIGATAAARGGGRHVVIASDHHFPHLVSEEFNDTLDALMRNADATHEEQSYATPYSATFDVTIAAIWPLRRDAARVPGRHAGRW